ncbi:MAG: lipoate--protein ligase [Flavobacteriales bacterium]|nr:lipoate--protein ligase [Flavobacteriales bacterium]
MPKTFLILSDQDDPAFNLATEDVLLNNTSHEYVFLYINRPTVVIGKHQNPYAEANLSFCNRHGIGIHRRLSGGGTVFHDAGNVNFCFIRNMEDKERLIDFGRFLRPVQDYLKSRGIIAEFSGRNDLLVDGYKISGNAEHVVQKSKRVIHHGTLLFDSQLELLHDAIHPNPRVRVISHAVHSVRSPVTNLKGRGELPENAQLFMHDLAQYLATALGAEPFEPEQYFEQIRKAKAEKYSSWDWNFGYTPHYTMLSSIGTDLKLEVEVRRSEILKAGITSEQKGYLELPGLIGRRHAPEDLARFFLESPPRIDGIDIPESFIDWF